MCNRSGLDSNGLYLSEEDINNLDGIIAVGGGASMMLEGLVAYGLLEGATPPGGGLLLAGFLVANWGLIRIAASGCGVVVSINIGFTGVGYSIDPQ